MSIEVRRSPPRPARGRFQFSLRTLLVLMVMVAVGCSLLVASPGWVRSLTASLVALAIAPAATVALVRGRGYVRSFAIGAAFPAGVAFISDAESSLRDILNARFLPPSQQESLAPAWFVVALLGACVLCGVVGMVVHWLIDRAQREP